MAIGTPDLKRLDGLSTAVYHPLMKQLVVVLFSLLVFGCSRDVEEKKVCVDAADRYVECVGEVLGPEMQATVKAKGRSGVKECSKDERAQKAYTICLAKPDCEAFMDCTMSIAMGEMPE